MPLVIKRAPIFMCTICGRIHKNAEDAVSCESEGIFMPSCGEGDIIDRNYDPKTKNDFLCTVVGHDDSHWINFRDKVFAVRLEKVGRGYPYGNSPDHFGLPMTFLCKNRDGYNTQHYTNITAVPDVTPKKVANWREYFEELKKRNPSIVECENFKKYGNEEYIASLLYNIANNALNGGFNHE